MKIFGFEFKSKKESILEAMEPTAVKDEII